MRLNQYQEKAKETATSTANSMTYLALGLNGESGEVAELVKKALRVGLKGQNIETFRERCVDELGDVLWYVAVFADYFGVTLDEVAQRNLNKVNARKVSGYFKKDE